MVTRFTGRIAAVLAGVGASFVFASAPASAQEGPIVVTAPLPSNLRVERVAFHDINLATRAGQETLHRRVNQAVERVCLHDEGRWYGLSVPDYNYCASQAWSRARPQIIGAVSRALQFAYYRRY